MEQAVEAVVDDLPRRDDKLLAKPRQLVGVQVVEHAPVIREQGPDPMGIEHVQRYNPARVVPLLENVGIAGIELRQHPGFEKLNARLIVVRLRNDAKIAVFDLVPDSVLVTLDKT